MEEAWRRLPASVQISTKLNRSALIPGEVVHTALPRANRDRRGQRRTICRGRGHDWSLSRLKVKSSLQDLIFVPSRKSSLDCESNPADNNRVRLGTLEPITREFAMRSGDLSGHFAGFNVRIDVSPADSIARSGARAHLEDKERQGQLHRAQEPPKSRSRQADDPTSNADHVRTNDQFNTTIYSYARTVCAASPVRAKFCLCMRPICDGLIFSTERLSTSFWLSRRRRRASCCRFRATRYDVLGGELCGLLSGMQSAAACLALRQT